LFQSDADFICHQVNCQGKMGSGLGGADWGTISKMIEEELGADYSVELWRKEG
jgi:O-acetyl-ADP-ribose deacetylase (regulator of RNase III)